MSLEPTTKAYGTAPPTVMHTVECGRSTLAWSNKEEEAMVREVISRMVAVLAEAGGPLPTTDVCRRLGEDGWTPYWSEARKTALKERTIWSPEDGVLSLPQKRRQMSPEARARHLAFDKARKLGVVRHTGERYVLTDRQNDGLLTPSELEMAERSVNRCNALGTPEAEGMHDLWFKGKVTKEELDAFTSDLMRRADEQPLVHAQDGARIQ